MLRWLWRRDGDDAALRWCVCAYISTVRVRNSIHNERDTDIYIIVVTFGKHAFNLSNKQKNNGNKRVEYIYIVNTTEFGFAILSILSVCVCICV